MIVIFYVGIVLNEDLAPAWEKLVEKLERCSTDWANYGERREQQLDKGEVSLLYRITIREFINSSNRYLLVLHYIAINFYSGKFLFMIKIK